jgi:hypothetical protein
MLPPAEGSDTTDGQESAKHEFQIFTYDDRVTSADVLRSPKLPQRGEPYQRYEWRDPFNWLADPSTGADYVRVPEDQGGPNVILADLIVTNREIRRDASQPRLWHLTVSYEGKTSPLNELPEVQSMDEQYQEYTNVDTHGRLVANSALDPFLGGMPRDRSTKVITITRNLPFSMWDMDRGDDYKHTLNQKPYILPRQGKTYPPGTVRIKKITEQLIPSARGVTPNTSTYYWRVTIELMVDKSKYLKTDGTYELTKHRYIVADAGFNWLDDSVTPARKKKIMAQGADQVTEPQLLDGRGRVLPRPASSPPDDKPIPLGFPDGCLFWATATGEEFTIPAPGVMAGSTAISVETVTQPTQISPGGAFALNSDGSFTYRSKAGFTGWDFFTYRELLEVNEAGNVYSDDLVVQILVGVRPVYLAFDRYRYADWTALSALLEDW